MAAVGPCRRPSRTTMSNSALVTGCTERRAPFLVTIICSSPLVVFRVASESVSGNRSMNPRSTMNQTGDALLLRASKYLCPFFHAK